MQGEKKFFSLVRSHYVYTLQVVSPVLFLDGKILEFFFVFL